MKYFGWTPEIIDNMSWHNYTMYLASIPRYDNKKKEDDEITGQRDLFNMYDKK